MCIVRQLGGLDIDRDSTFADLQLFSQEHEIAGQANWKGCMI